MFPILAMPLFSFTRDPGHAARRMAAMFGTRAEGIAATQARESLLAGEREAWRFWLDVRIDLMARRLGVGEDQAPQPRWSLRRKVERRQARSIH